jgi:hypothetical protein
MNSQPKSHQSPAWQKRYREALLESDRKQVPGRIHVAMDSLVRHLRETNPDMRRHERDRILQALRMLELLQSVSGDTGPDSRFLFI